MQESSCSSVALHRPKNFFDDQFLLYSPPPASKQAATNHRRTNATCLTIRPRADFFCSSMRLTRESVSMMNG
jgi:hypothetical protein